MTPKEKASELILEFTKYAHADYHNGELVKSMELLNAKYCALHCVSEVLKSFDSIFDSRKNFRHELEIDAERYWLEVRKEIELL